MISKARKIINKSEKARLLMSYSGASLMAFASLVYLFPNEFVRSPSRPKQFSGSLLVFIENLTKFPIWSSLFAICAIALFYALIFNKAMIWRAHWLNCVVSFLYATSLWYGALIAPGTYIVLPAFASYLVISHYLLAISYVERPAE